MFLIFSELTTLKTDDVVDLMADKYPQKYQVRPNQCGRAIVFSFIKLLFIIASFNY